MTINLNTFRVFLTVYELKSMTTAATSLHLTQSGVSQHIKTLEYELGFPLFERKNKKLFPTAHATFLYNKGRKGLLEIEQAVRETKQVDEVPRGLVRIGLPMEYGHNVAIPELGKLGRKYPDLDFALTNDFATTLTGMVLRGELDFALIDRVRVDSSLRVETVATETLYLCGLRSYVRTFGPVKPNTAYFSQMHYVDYAEGAPIVRSWFRHHLQRQNIDLRVRAQVFNAQAVARLICSGLGLGVLPHFVVERLKSENVDLYIYEGRRAELKNEICMIYLPLRDRPPSHKVAMAALGSIGL